MGGGFNSELGIVAAHDLRLSIMFKSQMTHCRERRPRRSEPLAVSL